MEFNDIYFLAVWRGGRKHTVSSVNTYQSKLTCWKLSLKSKRKVEMIKSTMLEF